MIMSTAPKCSPLQRKLSRQIRRIRLRLAALGSTFFATAKPSRALPTSFERYKTAKYLSCERCAASKTCLKSAAFSNRLERLKLKFEEAVAVSPARAAAETSGWLVTQSCPFALAPAFQNCPTALGGHSRTKAMGAFTFYSAWLIGTFHWIGRLRLQVKPADILGWFRKTRMASNAWRRKRARKITRPNIACQ